MQVFKAYFKVLRNSSVAMVINLVVFLGLSVMFSANAGPPISIDFMQTQTPIAIINRDKGALLAQGLADYLSETNKLMPYPDDPEQLQDALFYRNVEYIAIIPAGFSDSFLATGECTLQKVVVPGSASSYYVDLRISRYLNTLRLYQQLGGGKLQTEMLAAVKADLALEASVTVQDSGTTGNTVQGFVYYYGYLAYVVLTLIIFGVSSVMLTFNQTDLRRRNQCTPLPLRSMNLQLAAGHGIFALGCWAILVLFSFALYGKELVDSNLAWLYCLNSFVFAVVCTSIGFLAGSLIKNYSAQAGAVNVVTLGMCFICGVYVPQSIMNPSVLAIAKFLPAYWYIKARDALVVLTKMTPENMSPIYSAMLIQLGFATAIFSVTLLLSKERRMSVN